MEYCRHALARWPHCEASGAISCSPTIPSAWVKDGPTHQPVETLASLRTTPNMSTWRPADAVRIGRLPWKAAL